MIFAENGPIEKTMTSYKNHEYIPPGGKTMFETKDAILVTNLIFVFAIFVLIPMKASTICTTNLSTFRKKNERERKNLNSLSSKST